MAAFRKKLWYGASGGNPVSVGDNAAGDFICEPNPPVFVRNVRQEKLPLAVTPTYIDDKNEVCELVWTVERIHKDADTAFQFSRLHDASIESLGYLQDGGDNFTNLFLVGASISTRCTMFNDGLSTKFEYKVRGGYWTTVQPK